MDRNIQAVYGKIGTTTIGSSPLPCLLLACVYVRVHPVSLDRVSECKTSAPSSGWCFQPPNLGDRDDKMHDQSWHWIAVNRPASATQAAIKPQASTSNAFLVSLC